MTAVADQDLRKPDAGRQLKVKQVAASFGVSPRTITRWAALGILPCTRTLGGPSGRGHRRFWEAEIEPMLAQWHSRSQRPAESGAR